jgi:xanthine dehydrogenase accessory factor
MKRPGDSAPRALIRGAGDLATGIALTLHHAGFAVVMTEIGRPTAIRRSVAFCQAVFDGAQTVEGVTARLCDPANIGEVLRDGNIAVVVDPESAVRAAFGPTVAVDAILAKKNLGTTRDFAPIVIGCGPGFQAGADVDAVIETMRGHELGRLIMSGSAQEDTGVPGEIAGRTAERILRAPVSGPVRLEKKIGDLVSAGELVMMVGDAPVHSPLSGCVRGLISEGLAVPKGLKVGDIDPRGDSRYCFVVSDKARAVGRAALEAALILGRERGLFRVAMDDQRGAL